MTKRIEDISFENEYVTICGYATHNKLESNVNTSRKEGSCREKKLDELNSIDNLFKDKIFYEYSLLIEELIVLWKKYIK